MANATPKTKKTATPKAKQAVKKASPIKALTPFEEMEREFDLMFRHGGFPSRLSFPHFWGNIKAFEGKTPSVDMIDQKDNILIKAELPGVDKKDLDISVTDKTVTIKGKTKKEKKEEKGNYFRREISSGSYERVLAIPGNVDSSKAKAKFADGVLELTLPKTDKGNGKKVKVE